MRDLAVSSDEIFISDTRQQKVVRVDFQGNLIEEYRDISGPDRIEYIGNEQILIQSIIGNEYIYIMYKI